MALEILFACKNDYDKLKFDRKLELILITFSQL